MDFFGDTTGLYFYSAVFQGNMALVGLTAVFVVYRLQQIAAEIQHKDATFVTLVSDYLLHDTKQHVVLNYENVGEIPDILREMRDNRGEDDPVRKSINRLEGNAAFQMRIIERTILFNTAAELRSRMRYPFVLTLVVAAASLALLPAAHSVHAQSAVAEIGLIAVIFLMNVAALVLTARLVFKTMRLFTLNEPPSGRNT